MENLMICLRQLLSYREQGMEPRPILHRIEAQPIESMVLQIFTVDRPLTLWRTLRICQSQSSYTHGSRTIIGEKTYNTQSLSIISLKMTSSDSLSSTTKAAVSDKAAVSEYEPPSQ